MKADPGATARAVANRVAKVVRKVAATAVAAVARDVAVVVAVDAASAAVKAHANAWMPKANPWQPNSAPMAHARHPTWLARKHRVVTDHRAPNVVATAVSAAVASAMNKVNVQPHRSAVSPAPTVVANAAPIAIAVLTKAHAPRQTHKPTCRSKAQRQPKVQTVANASKVALNQRPRAQTVRSRASAAHVAATVIVAHAANAQNATSPVNAASAANPANVRNARTCRSSRKQSKARTSRASPTSRCPSKQHRHRPI